MSKNSFRYFKTSPEVIRPAAMMYVRFPLSLRNVEDLLYERGIDLSHETVRFWWNRFGPMFAAEIRKRRADRAIRRRSRIRILLPLFRLTAIISRLQRHGVRASWDCSIRDNADAFF